jgi:hypothetical protein
VNWYRGLKRLWIVLSALWIIAGVWLLEPIALIRAARSPVIVSIGSARIEVPRGTPLPEIKKALLDYAHDQDAKKPNSADNFLDGLDAAHVETTVETALSTYDSRPWWQVVCSSFVLIPDLNSALEKVE